MVQAEEKQPEAPADPGAGGSASGGGGEGEEAAPADDRRYDSLKLVNWQARSERKLPIPLVSSIAVFLLGMAALSSLVGRPILAAAGF